MGAIVLMVTAGAFGAAFGNTWLGLGVGGTLVLAATIITAVSDE